MTDQNVAISQKETEKKNEFRLNLLKDEIAAQGNAFDQIDSKTGVALGFTFVVVGQVLASVFRISTDQNHLQSSHPSLTATVFVAANCLAIAAIISGIVARWPRKFNHGIEFNVQEIDGKYEDLMKGAIDALSRATNENQTTNSSKGNWALATYLLVGGTLIAYLGLTVILYFYSIPNSNRKTDSAMMNLQVSPTRDINSQKASDTEVRGTGLTRFALQTPPTQRGISHHLTSSSDPNTTKRESEVERKLKAIIVEQLQVDESKVTSNANFKIDLGADDLDVVELVMQVEEAFNLEIDDGDAKKLTTVKDMVDYIEQHTNQRVQK